MQPDDKVIVTVAIMAAGTEAAMAPSHRADHAVAAKLRPPGILGMLLSGVF